MKKLGFILKFWTKSILFLPGTFAHELMHFIVAILTGSKITSFSLTPKLTLLENGRYNAEFGSVGFIPRIQAFNFLIGMAPLLLWGVILLVLYKTNILQHYGEGATIDLERLFSFSSIWIWLMIIQLGWGGVPSVVDLKTSVRGFFSFSGLVLIGVVAAGIYLYDFTPAIDALFPKPYMKEI